MVDVGIIILATSLTIGTIVVWLTRVSSGGFLVWGIIATLFSLGIGFLTLDTIQFGEKEVVTVFGNGTVITDTEPRETDAYINFVPVMAIVGSMLILAFTFIIYFRIASRETITPRKL